MSFSFVRNDAISFAQYNRVYEVYNYDEERYLRTAIVIGYLEGLERYYITLLGDNLLQENYGLGYKDIGDTEFIKILHEFFSCLSLMTIDDLLGPEYKDVSNLPPLLKSNFLIYMSDMEPYYMEELDDYDGIYSTTDDHANYLLDNSIAIPYMLENYDADEYQRYNYDDFVDLFYDNVDAAIYCTIDYELLHTYAL